MFHFVSRKLETFLVSRSTSGDLRVLSQFQPLVVCPKKSIVFLRHPDVTRAKPSECISCRGYSNRSFRRTYRRRRLSQSDDESDDDTRTETGSTPPTSVAPTRVMPRRSAYVYRIFLPLKMLNESFLTLERRDRDEPSLRRLLLGETVKTMMTVKKVHLLPHPREQKKGKFDYSTLSDGILY